MGGTVKVESEEGKGTTFSFDIRTKGKRVASEEEHISMVQEQLGQFQQ